MPDRPFQSSQWVSRRVKSIFTKLFPQEPKIEKGLSWKDLWVYILSALWSPWTTQKVLGEKKTFQQKRCQLGPKVQVKLKKLNEAIRPTNLKQGSNSCKPVIFQEKKEWLRGQSWDRERIVLRPWNLTKRHLPSGIYNYHGPITPFYLVFLAPFEPMSIAVILYLPCLVIVYWVCWGLSLEFHGSREERWKEATGRKDSIMRSNRRTYK